MDRFRTGGSLSPIRQAEAYWTALRRDGSIPKRSQIDPRGIGNILANCFILERIAPGIARLRLAGQHMNALAGMEVRGMPLTALFTPQRRGEMGAILEHVFDTPAVAELSLTSEARFRRAMLDARMLLLPLRCEQGDISRALGVLVSEGDASRPPCRFGISRIELRDLKRQDSRKKRVSSCEMTTSGFSEDKKPFNRPHLRLVASKED
ncbi:PAS domain-containing protein [Cribrihabitans sp. XS_ASV171]